MSVRCRGVTVEGRQCYLRVYSEDLEEADGHQLCFTHKDQRPPWKYKKERWDPAKERAGQVEMYTKPQLQENGLYVSVERSPHGVKSRRWSVNGARWGLWFVEEHEALFAQRYQAAENFTELEFVHL